MGVRAVSIAAGGAFFLASIFRIVGGGTALKGIRFTLGRNGESPFFSKRITLFPSKCGFNVSDLRSLSTSQARPR